ncbi:MAG: hypothetical protein WCK67_13450 [bacterium]
MTKKVLVISYYFPPTGGAGVQRTLKFVKYLIGYDIEPIVITIEKDLNQPDDKELLEEVPSTLKIIRTTNYNFIGFLDYFKKLRLTNIINKINFIFNLLITPDAMLFWYFFNRKNILEIVKKENIDTIYTTSSPYSSHLFGLYLKRKLKKINWISDFRDAWTDNPSNHYNKLFKYNFVRRLIDKSLEKKIIYSSDFVITAAEIISEYFIKTYKTDKIQTITNGYDESDFAAIPVKEINLEKFRIMHFGSLFSNYHPMNFLNAFADFIETLSKEEKNKIEVNFYGRMKNHSSILDFCNEKNIQKYIEFSDYIPHKTMLNKAANYDLTLLFIPSDEFNKGVYTGKLFELIRLNVPILAMVHPDGVAANIIRNTKTGYVYDFEDVSGIKSQISECYRNWKESKLYSEYSSQKNWDEVKQYDRKILTEKLADKIKSF